MSKRVQRYECDECGESYRVKMSADECEQEHEEQRHRDACEKLSRDIGNELWALTLAQLAEVQRTVKLMIAANRAPTPDPETR